MKISGLDQKTNIISTNNVLTDSYIIMNCTETVQDEVTQTIQSKPITYKVSLGELGNALINTFKIVTYDNENGNKKLNTINNNYVATQIGNFVTGELNVDNISGFGANKTLAGLTETDGLISASFQDIAITSSQINDISSAINSTASTAATSKAVNDALSAAKSYADDKIIALNGGTIGNPAANKTISSISESNGQISVAFQDISITKSQISDLANWKPSYALTELTNIPALPLEDGTYTLQVTINNGEATYSWI